MSNEMYFETLSGLTKYLETKLGFSDDVDLSDLEEYEEESYKRQTRCSGYLHNQTNDTYYLLQYLHDYDWGSSNFILDTTPCQKYSEVKLVEAVSNVFKPIKGELDVQNTK